MGNFFSRKIEQAIGKERSPHKLAISAAVGVGIAFSPYLGLQTILLLIVSWIFSLHTGLVFVLVYLINNPWTMIPIAALDYIVGVWISKTLLHIDLAAYNPSWMVHFNHWLDVKIGVYIRNYINVTDLSLWAYIIGGHVVAIVAGLITYPIAKRIFQRMIEKLPEPSTDNIP